MLRTSCAVCESDIFSLRPIYIQHEYPVCICSSELSLEKDTFTDLMFVGCETCGSVQLKNLIDPLLLYSLTHNNTYDTPTWFYHHKTFADFILKHTEKNDFLEIGGVTGVLAKLLSSQRPNLDYHIMDLAENSLSDSPYRYIQANCEEYDYTQIDSKIPIILSHVFEHLYNPRRFIEKLQQAKIQSVFLSVPNMEICLKKNFLSFLHVEHTYYCEEAHILRMMAEAGYECKVKEEYREHSLFFWFERKEELTILPAYPDAKYLLNLFQTYYEKRDSSYKDISLDQPTFIVPGGHFGQLIYFYLRNQKDKIIGFLDNDLTKRNKRVYGTDKYVYSMSEVTNKTGKVSILLNAGPYVQEIKSQLLSYNPSIEFIEVS